MKIKYYLILLLLTILSGYSVAQQQGKNIILDQPIYGGIHEYEASQSIKLLPGFSYKPNTSSDRFSAKINPHLLFPPEDGLTGGPNPGDDGILGNLEGVLNVTNLGAASYNIPIGLPRGIGNMVPNITIAYNSMAGNGFMGMGWSIGGLSAISRTGTTIYHDGYIKGITFDDTDNLMLDGNRLFNVAGNEYRTEIETFSKIVIKESNAYGPVWFEVRTKDGRILEYGRNADSQLIPGGKQHVLSWHLNRIEDRRGNHIDYEYTQNNDEILISKIKYGGNHKTGQSHIYEIIFNYEEGRPDVNKGYISGGSLEMNSLLSSIDVKKTGSSDYIANYYFDYDHSVIHTRLEKIIPYKGGEKLNPLKFEWGETEEPFTLSETNIVADPDYYSDYTFGDFSGNGKTDVAVAYYTGTIYEKNFSHWVVYYANIYGYFTKVEMGNFSSWLPSSESFVYFEAGDFNGNGIDDLVMVSKKWISGTYMFHARFLFSTVDGFQCIIIIILLS